MFNNKNKEKFEDDFCYGDEVCKAAKRKKAGGICKEGILSGRRRRRY